MNGRTDTNSAGNPIIGIDLGTSTSEIAVLKNGRPELLQDEQGERIISSVVQLAPDGQLLVGAAAKRGAIAYADRTALEVKRLMGTDAVVTLGERTFRPEEVSAMILRHLKSAAESKLGANSVRDVVLSVPARFDNPAREATRRAAELAGLNVLRLINEPTAAALSYGLDRLRDEQKVLVFDFGGGTLDVTVLEMFEGVLDVKTSVGDDRLGGKDVDELLMGLFRRKFHEQKGFELTPGRDLRADQTLKQEAEGYKRQLSSAYSVSVDIPYLSAQGGVSFTLTRGDFDGLIADLLGRAMRLVDEALGRAKLTYADIGVILPVGGSSRIPAFRRELERRWGRSLQEYDNPDEAVARGAAIAAGIEKKEFAGENDIMILDVTPHRLGVAVLEEVGDGQYIEDFFSEIIAKDAQLPAIGTRDYATLHDGQDSINVRIFQATTDGNLCQDHRLIAEMPMENIPPAPAGQPIRIEFRYTADGTLDARAHCLLAPDVTIDGRFSVVGRAAQGDDMAERVQAAIDTLWQNSEDMKLCAPLLDQAEQVERENPAAGPRVRAAADALRGALAAGDKAAVQTRFDVLTDLLFELS